MSGRKKKEPTVINLLILGHGELPVEMQIYHSRSNETNPNLFPTTDLTLRSDDKLSIDLIMVDETRECSLIDRSEMDKIIQIASDSFSETGEICNPKIVTILNSIQDEELQKEKILSSTYKFKLFQDVKGLINKTYTLDTNWRDIPPYKIFCEDRDIQRELTRTLTPSRQDIRIPTLLRDVLFEILSTCRHIKNINNIKINIVDTSCNYLYSRGNVKIDSFIATGGRKQRKTKKIKRIRRKKTKKLK